MDAEVAALQQQLDDQRATFNQEIVKVSGALWGPWARFVRVAFPADPVRAWLQALQGKYNDALDANSEANEVSVCMPRVVWFGTREILGLSAELCQLPLVRRVWRSPGCWSRPQTTMTSNVASMN